jgi:hypothetical protein
MWKWGLGQWLLHCQQLVLLRDLVKRGLEGGGDGEIWMQIAQPQAGLTGVNMILI